MDNALFWRDDQWPALRSDKQEKSNRAEITDGAMRGESQLQRIKVNPRYPIDESELDPRDTIFPEITFLIDDGLAISTDGFFVSIVGVVPDEDEPGTFRMADDWDQYIFIAIDDERTFEGLERIVKQLKAMSAYKLLVEHFDQIESTFFINRDRSFTGGFRAEDLEPVSELAPRAGRDY